jgi:hypothetical protein
VRCVQLLFRAGAGASELLANDADDIPVEKRRTDDGDGEGTRTVKVWPAQALAQPVSKTMTMARDFMLIEARAARSLRRAIHSREPSRNSG